MAREWMRWCKSQGLRVDGDEIEVRFADQRSHRVRVDDEVDELRVVGIVARPNVASGISDLAPRVWRRNRATQLLGFRIDERGQLIGEARVPKAGLTPAELAIYVRQVAAECDRLEYLLTGKDVE